jgi:UDP-glucose 4-epimerase
MKYLITGGAGFIGSHLVEKLILRGDSVVVLDDFSTGNIDNLINVKGKCILVEGNVLDLDLVNRHIKSVDYVIHLAAAVGVFNIVNNPLQSLLINLKGTQNILENCDFHKKPLMFLSTSEVYGKNEKTPLGEEDDRIIGHPFLARWTYSEAKAIDESLAYFYHLERNLSVRTVRLFNTVGPRQKGEYGMVLPRFVKAALLGEPLIVFGEGEQIRCFCHVEDAVRALVLVLDAPEAVGQVFNIGNSEQISILELAQKVIDITESKSVINKIPYDQAYPKGFEDMQKRVPDIAKINRVLGWKPQINLEQIVKDIAAFNSK